MPSSRDHRAPYFLGIDLGGTNVRAGVVTDEGVSLSLVSRPTAAERGVADGIKNLLFVAEHAVDVSGLSWDKIAGVGLATPGTMDIPAGIMLRPHNLLGWQDVPIRQIISDALQKPTVLQNDANAAAYGEYWIGAGKDASSLLMWTLGTGTGSGLIIHDLIIEGAHSCGSECGHIIIEMDGGRRCHSGQYGTLEAYASATALVERAREALQSGRATSISDKLADGNELSPIIIAEAAQQGDALANELILEVARCLGVGTVSIMHAVNPALVLIGGGMTFGRHQTELGRQFLARVQEEIRHRAFPVPAERTIVDYATLGGDAGYIGAAGCVRRALRLGELT